MDKDMKWPHTEGELLARMHCQVTSPDSDSIPRSTEFFLMNRGVVLVNSKRPFLINIGRADARMTLSVRHENANQLEEGKTSSQ